MKLLPLTRILSLNLATAKPARDEIRHERERIYDTALWKRIRKAKLSRDPCCQACLVKGRQTPANEVDHRLAIVRGGNPWADSNLVSMCTACHSIKTQAENSGKPLPPIVASARRHTSIA